MTTTRALAVYRPVAAAIDPNAKLFAAEWALLLNLTGRHSLAQLGRTLGLDAQACESAAVRLLERGLIVESEVTAAEYLAALAGTAPETGESTLLALLQRGGLASLPPAPSGPVAATVVATPAPAASVEPHPSQRASAPGVATSPPPFRPVARSLPPRPRGLSLRELMAFLIGRARNRDQGQLDVYRVFLRVRRDALERSGITTLRFDEDRVVSDPALLDSIGEAVESVLGVSLPATVWVEREAAVPQ